MTRFPNLTLVDHPLLRHKLTLLRDRETPAKIFRELTAEVTLLLGYEATRDLSLRRRRVRTPLESMEGDALAADRVVLVPVLRAGLGMVEPLLDLVPTASIGHIGLYREHDSLRPVEYYFKLPEPAADVEFFVLDPMLATGGSAAEAIERLRGRGAERIRLLSIVAAPEGVQAMLERHSDVPVVAGALDRGLDENGYIRPGLGDAGDRLFGTS